MSKGFENAPTWLTWAMTFINRIGFPIAVCIYLGYVQINAMPKVVDALNAVNSTLGELKNALKENDDVFRRLNHERPRRDND